MHIKKNLKCAALLGAAITGLSLTAAEYPAEGTLELEFPLPEAQVERFGSIPANRQIGTNMFEIVEALRTNILYKQDRHLFGEGLTTDKAIYYKLTLAGTSDTYHVPPPHEFVYASGLNSSANIYGPNMLKMTRWDDTANIGYGIYGQDNDKFVALTRDGNKDTWSYTANAVTGLVVTVDISPTVTYDWSNPKDWRIMWSSDESEDQSIQTDVTNEVVNTARVMTTVERGVTKNSTAQLYVDYLDEKNIPDFSTVAYEITDGAATLVGDRLTATQPGVVKIKGTANNGEARSVDVSMYQWKTTSTISYYGADNPAMLNRKRVNDYILQTLQEHRSTPNTNYTYNIWNSPGHHANTGDRFTGEWGSIFRPFQFVSTDSSGSASFWWSHAALSKHVLLSAAHYGDYNHNRHLNGFEYFNHDGKMSGRKQVKCVKWYYLAQWATEHGFEGTDTIGHDIGFWVLDGEVPDECLPYIASADWLNNYYGVDIDKSKGEVIQTTMAGINLCQANMVRLKAVGTTTWGASYYLGPSESLNLNNEQSAYGPYNCTTVRNDIWQYARKGGWHSLVVGDSGHPTFIYDPAITGAYNGQTFIRPILLTAATTVASGSTVPQMTKVIRAFCAWVAEQKGITLAEEMPYTLGDVDNQSTDVNVINQNAYNAMAK